MRFRDAAALFLALAAAGCGILAPKLDPLDLFPEEATALTGQSLRRIVPDDGGTSAELEGKLAAARARWEADGLEEDAIWVGRHLAYLGRYQLALEWYTDRLRDFPASARLRRHRGHRFLSTRQLDNAVEDLRAAWELLRGSEDQVEPDGAPNKYDLPRSTTHTNVLYHLGLAYYLRGEWDTAATVFDACRTRCTNDDMLVATLNWLVHSLRRSGRHQAAREHLKVVQREMNVIENHAYHRLLLLQKGLMIPDDVLGPGGDGVQDATALYGIATWSLCNGNTARAKALWRAIVDRTPWNAFGHLCAEAELAR